MTKHLYIHIPFCKSICTYCDFVRIHNINPKTHKTYIDLVIEKLQNEASLHQFTTIYIGGGTPNALNDENLEYLLNFLSKYLNLNTQYEFCIELNPELITVSQVHILAKYGINRVSLGVQTTNDKINVLLHRYSTMQNVVDSLKILRQNNICNISCDFMYNLPLLKEKDLEDAISFLKKENIQHVSFYALEMKENSILNKKHYKPDIDNEQLQYLYINEHLKTNGYERYEVASYCLNHQYGKHNLAYWKNEDWKAIGSGAYGFENGIYYSYKPNFNILEKDETKYSNKELYQHVLIMGLRTKFGLDLSISLHKKAYEYFYHEIKDDTYISNNHLIIKDIDYLDDCLVKII